MRARPVKLRYAGSQTAVTFTFTPATVTCVVVTLDGRATGTDAEAVTSNGTDGVVSVAVPAEPVTFDRERYSLP